MPGALPGGNQQDRVHPMALPMNTDAIVQSLWFTTAQAVADVCERTADVSLRSSRKPSTLPGAQRTAAGCFYVVHEQTGRSIRPTWLTFRSRTNGKGPRTGDAIGACSQSSRRLTRKFQRCHPNFHATGNGCSNDRLTRRARYSNGRSHDGDWLWLRGCAAWPFCGPDNFLSYGRLKSPFAKAR